MKRLLKINEFSVANRITYITKTYRYNFDYLKPHFYIVKLRSTGVYIIFLISAQNHRLWVLCCRRGEAVLTCTHNYCFDQKYKKKYQIFFHLKTLSFLVVIFSIHLNRRVFIMYEPLRQKTYLRTCAPSEDLDQLAHSRCLIRIFTWRILKSQECNASVCGQRRMHACAGRSEFSLGTHAECTLSDRLICKVTGCVELQIRNV